MNQYQSYFSLIFENNDFVVINKRENINFHSEDGEFGVVVAVEKEMGIKLYSVHRLDKMTSGLLLLAKSSSIAAQLSALFKDHLIQKYYLAISGKKPKKKQGWIKGGMEKSRRSMWKLTKNKENLAMTQFFSFSVIDDKNLSKRLFVVKPKTGKTHQIRVALKSIGSAICGDPLYGEKNVNIDRGYLHAYQITFVLNDAPYNFVAMPEFGSLFLNSSTQKMLKKIGQLENLNWPK